MSSRFVFNNQILTFGVENENKNKLKFLVLKLFCVICFVISKKSIDTFLHDSFIDVKLLLFLELSIIKNNESDCK